MRAQTAILLILSISAVESVTRYRPEKAALSPEAFNKLMECLKSIDEEWQVSIDNGAIVLHCGDDTDTGCEATECVDAGIRHFDIDFDHGIYANTRAVKHADALWAEEQGAQGLVYVSYETDQMRIFDDDEVVYCGHPDRP